MKHIAIISPFYSPNVGGVETHLHDLVNYLISHKYKVTVFTYQPVMLDSKLPLVEKHENLTIFRYTFPFRGLFNTLESFPPIQLLYLTPILLVKSLIWFIFHHRSITCIHSHGINAALIGNILGKLFNLRHINSTHAVYENLNNKIVRTAVVNVYNRCNKILCLSIFSQNQLLSWGVKPKILTTYKYWIDLKLFKPTETKTEQPSVVFVGRLIAKKGIKILVSVAIAMPKIRFYFAGLGPLEEYLVKAQSKHKNIFFLGGKNQTNLPRIYSASWITCVPSLYPEGFGRVIAESLACGTPVLCSNLGATIEAMDNSTGISLFPNIKNIKLAINKIIASYENYKYNCRPYAIKNFSSNNAKLITDNY